MRLLLIEDEISTADALAELFRQEGYDVTVRNDGISGLNEVLTDHYDAMILDVMLPGIDGLEVMRRVRKSGNTTPTLLLTAKSTTEDKVSGLDSGADDYLTKPFAVEELLARVRALCRRNAAVTEKNMFFGDLILHLQSARLSCKTTEKSTYLSEKEFQILSYLITNGGQIISQDQMTEWVWGYAEEVEYNNVAVYISFLRKKLTEIGSEERITTVRGLGYRLEKRDV